MFFGNWGTRGFDLAWHQAEHRNIDLNNRADKSSSAVLAKKGVKSQLSHYVHSEI